MRKVNDLQEQLKQANEAVLECSDRLDNFNNKEGEWDDIYDHLCQGEIEKELRYKREQRDQLKNKINELDMLNSNLLIVKQQYEELISYDGGFKNKEEVKEYYMKLGKLSTSIKQIENHINYLEGK